MTTIQSLTRAPSQENFNWPSDDIPKWLFLSKHKKVIREVRMWKGSGRDSVRLPQRVDVSSHYFSPRRENIPRRIVFKLLYSKSNVALAVFVRRLDEGEEVMLLTSDDRWLAFLGFAR